MYIKQTYHFEAKTKSIVERLTQISATLHGRNRTILDALIQAVPHARQHADTREMISLLKTLWTDKCSFMKDVFAGETYDVLVAIFGEDLAVKFRTIWERSVHYIYDTSYARRSWRCKGERMYLRPTLTKLFALLFLVEEGFSPDRYFDHDLLLDSYIIREFFYQVVPDLWALEIDNGNQAVKQKLKEIMFAETAPGDQIRPVIKALLMSHDSEAHQWVGELLLAAKLQEGLRQAIAELMDQGSRTAFVYMLGLVLEHDLQRFSSFVRALDVWTGLGIEAQKPSVVKKCLTVAYRCLTDAPFIEECVASQDTILIYMGLWAMAVDNIDATVPTLKRLLTAPEKYKRTTALYFTEQTRVPIFQHQIALPMLKDPEMEVKCWALRNLFGGTITLRDTFTRQFGTASDLDQLLDRLSSLLQSMPKKEVQFAETVFPWSFIRVSQNDIILKMMVCSLAHVTDDKFDALMTLRDKMEVETRNRFVASFIKAMSPDRQRSAVLEFLGDKSSYVRSQAMKFATTLSFQSEDYVSMEDLMRLKSGDLRKDVMQLLLRQTPDALLQSIKRLAGEKNENKQLAALDLIESAEKHNKFQEIVEPCREIAVRIAATSQKANLLAQKLICQEQPKYTLANGFGFYDPQKHVKLKLPSDPAYVTSGPEFPSMDEVKKLLVGIDQVVDANKEYEYEVEWWGGGREKRTIGGQRTLQPFVLTHPPKTSLEEFPLSQVWRQAAVDLGATPKQVLAALFFFSYETLDGKAHSWFIELTSKLFPYSRQTCLDTLHTLKYPYHIQTILRSLLLEYPKPETFRLLCGVATSLVQSIPPERFTENYKAGNWSGDKQLLFTAKELAFWTSHMKQFVYDDVSFADFFAVCFKVYQLSHYQTRNYLDVRDFERAFDAGLIDENELYAELVGRASSPENIRIFSLPDTFYLKKKLESCHKLNELTEHVVDRVLSIELNRGDMPTEVSRLASKIERCYGVKYFVNILLAGEKTYTRGNNFTNASSTKQEMFSHILKSCYPAAGEDADTLCDLLNERKVSEKQLIEAAMYAPQWLEIVEKYLGWPGLTMTGWYFHAHISETFSNEKKTVMARYSPIDPEDFQYGAFDIRWFHEAYDTLGEKRFQMVYDSAKYICGGALHRRSQLFADAVLGHISVEEAEKVIREKRNKDYVLCLGLIPLAAGKGDMLQRYEFLQEFLKQSKQFGAQRRESEAKAVSFALENLARNAGFTDTNRFFWSMETEKMATIAPFFQPTRVGEVDLCISVDDLGGAYLLVEKGGKTLKSIPTSLKQDETAAKFKEVLKSLKDQYARARASLESAMVSESRFSWNEISDLTRHPIIRPLLRDLVFKSEVGLGYFREGTLVDPAGSQMEIQMDASCLIAHPVHLYESGQWSEFQRDIVSRQVTQPFKQVFRELYRPNADELASRTVSQRYAGHQIQPKKTVALLRGRGWTVSYEEGLQRVYHVENVIGHIYALADWFSPAEVEAPTLEEVHFTHRKTGELLPFDQIPPVIFSEVMRDVDLVVGVAHVGGVDPEASHSTIEMRAVLVTEMLRLMKLENVSIKGTHAHIAGKLGDYTVHLGSGMVHKMASGAVHILPVYAQHRGRIFLPFVDEDPRTAEIISKITLLAEDTKIKDPNILEQLRG